MIEPHHHVYTPTPRNVDITLSLLVIHCRGSGGSYTTPETKVNAPPSSLLLLRVSTGNQPSEPVLPSTHYLLYGPLPGTGSENIHKGRGSPHFHYIHRLHSSFGDTHQRVPILRPDNVYLYGVFRKSGLFGFSTRKDIPYRHKREVLE